MTENNDFINLQITLLNFLDKYKDAPGLDEEENMEYPDTGLDENVLFEMTVSGKLIYDLGHPKFGDDDFFNRLLQYYTTMEAYEKCIALLNLKKDSQLN
jgi:hypothetical protein